MFRIRSHLCETPQHALASCSSLLSWLSTFYKWLWHPRLSPFLTATTCQIHHQESSQRTRLLRPFKSVFSRCYSRSPSPSHRGAQSVTLHNANASISACATSAPQVDPQGTEHTAIVDLSTMSSISASLTNGATSAPTRHRVYGNPRAFSDAFRPDMGTSNERVGKYCLWRAENSNLGDSRLLRLIPTAADGCRSAPDD